MAGGMEDETKKGLAKVAVATASGNFVAAAVEAGGLLSSSAKTMRQAIEREGRAFIEDELKKLREHVGQVDEEFRHRIQGLETEAERQAELLRYLRERENLTTAEASRLIGEAFEAWQLANGPDKRTVVGAALRSSLFQRERFARHRQRLAGLVGELDAGDLEVLSAMTDAEPHTRSAWRWRIDSATRLTRTNWPQPVQRRSSDWL